MTAHIRHKDLAIQYLTFSLKVSCVLSLFVNETKIYFNKVTLIICSFLIKQGYHAVLIFRFYTSNVINKAFSSTLRL